MFASARGAHEVRAARNGVTGDDSSADASEELFAGHDLLAHQVTAALCLDLVLDVTRGKAGADVLGDGACNHGRAAEAVMAQRQTVSEKVKGRQLTQCRRQR